MSEEEAYLSFERLYDAGSFAELLVLCEAACRKNPHLICGLFFMGLANIELKNYGQAEENFLQVLKYNDKEAKAHLNAGVAAELKGDKDTAESEYKKELFLNPVSFEAMRNLGDLYFDQEKWNYASEMYRKLLIASGYDAKIAIKAAQCKYNMGDLVGESAFYREILETQPNNPWAQENLGRCLFDLGEFTESFLWLGRAAKNNPKSESLLKLYNSVKLHSRKGSVPNGTNLRQL